MGAALWALCAVVGASCGSRSGLESARGSGGGGNAGADASTGGVGGALADAGSDAAAPSCVLSSAGESVTLMELPNQNLNTPSAIVMNAGSAAQPARLALQALAAGDSSGEHSNIKLVRLAIGEPWPSGVAVETEPLQIGPEAHSWGNWVAAPGGRPEAALAWHSDPGNVGRAAFRLFDTQSWTAKDVVDLDLDGSTVLGLAAGKGAGAFGVGYSGDGYGITWRKGTEDKKFVSVVAVLDHQGGVQLGPHAVAPPSDSTGSSPDVVWTGNEYWMTTSFGTCAAPHPLCADTSVVVSRLRPASGSAEDDSGVDAILEIPALSGFLPLRASAAARGGDVYVAWREEYGGGAAIPGHVRLARLTQQGQLVGEPLRFNPSDESYGPVSVMVSDAGVTVLAAEGGDPNVPYKELGHHQIRVHHFRRDLTPLASVVVPATQVASAWPSAVYLEHPQSLLVVWSGQRIGPGPAVVWGARLDCDATPPLPDAGSAQYSAEVDLTGALDRVRIMKRDPVRDLCIRVFLAHASGGEPYAATVPGKWGIEGINVAKGAETCPISKWEGVQASAAAGSLSWDPPDSLPCFIDANLILSFPQSQSWVPATDTFSAKGIPVEGACPP